MNYEKYKKMKYKWARAKLSFFGIYEVWELVWKQVKKKFWVKKVTCGGRNLIYPMYEK
jgi:hypothetical protein